MDLISLWNAIVGTAVAKAEGKTQNRALDGIVAKNRGTSDCTQSPRSHRSQTRSRSNLVLFHLAKRGFHGRPATFFVLFTQVSDCVLRMKTWERVDWQASSWDHNGSACGPKIAHGSCSPMSLSTMARPVRAMSTRALRPRL